MEEMKQPAFLTETVNFLKDQDSTNYLLKMEATNGYGPATYCFSGDRERYLGITRKILAVLEPGPSEQILESLGRIEELLKKERQKT